MKNGGNCPKCGSGDVFVIDEAGIPDYQSSSSVRPLTLTAHYGPTGETGFLGMETSERVPVRIEAYVCAGCAFTELYAKDLDVLTRFARDRAGHARRR